MSVKGIWVSEILSAEIKSYRLSLPLPRGNPCRAFRKEVLKGETVEAPLKKASKNNISFNAERQFPVCDPATGRPSYEIMLFCATEIQLCELFVLNGTWKTLTANYYDRGLSPPSRRRRSPRKVFSEAKGRFVYFADRGKVKARAA